MIHAVSDHMLIGETLFMHWLRKDSPPMLIQAHYVHLASAGAQPLPRDPFTISVLI